MVVYKLPFTIFHFGLLILGNLHIMVLSHMPFFMTRPKGLPEMCSQYFFLRN